jgi:tRNA/tmRNA/rRNA uracil-C5-methylase (TrmA/RlmC/RlmD family)
VFAQFVLSIQPALSALSLVDTSLESIKYAKQNISNQIGKNSAIKFEANAVEVLKYLRNQVNENKNWDLAFVDPPRSGLNQQIIELLAKLKLVELVHISCDPASLARDFSNLVKSGYRLNHIKSFDLFPMTQHIETVAIFSSVLG